MVCRKALDMQGEVQMPRMKDASIQKRRRKTEKRDILEQYRKLRLVLPNIHGRGKISKVRRRKSSLRKFAPRFLLSKVLWKRPSCT